MWPKPELTPDPVLAIANSGPPLRLLPCSTGTQGKLHVDPIGVVRRRSRSSLPPLVKNRIHHLLRPTEHITLQYNNNTTTTTQQQQQ
jgi:hypothetical protein